MDAEGRARTDIPYSGSVEEEQERAWVQCHFHRARAHGKLDTPSSLVASLKEYELLSSYLAKHRLEGFADELNVCKEMVELLPHKIRNAQRAAATPAA